MLAFAESADEDWLLGGNRSGEEEEKIEKKVEEVSGGS